MFDAKEYFNETGINYWEEGKNISQDWVGIQCPFCDDRSNHLGITPDGIRYNCFRCGAKGSTVNLIKQLQKTSFKNAKALYNKYSTEIIYHDVDYDPVTKVEWPVQVRDKLEIPHKKYLMKRRFNPKLLEKVFNLKCCMHSGIFKYRILIPVYMEGKLMTFIGRDITGRAFLPYRNLSMQESIKPAKQCVYNIDNVDDKAIIVEGVTDVWRLGCYGVIATLGLVFTTAQVNRIASQVRNAYIMYDSEPQAIHKAEELGNLLSMAGVEKIEVVSLSKGDPADLPPSEADQFKRSLFGKRFKRRVL